MKKYTAIIIAVLVLLIVRTASRSELLRGVCLNADGDGMIYTDSEYNYISYSGTDAKQGDEILTFDLLNPFNNYCDDYLIRIDYNTTTKHITID